MTFHFTRFAEVVSLSSVRTANPLAAGIDRFVGLEHIEPENLHIHSLGNVPEGASVTNAFQRGQVIFIGAVNEEVTHERSMSYLNPEHQERIADAYHAFQDIQGFANVATLYEIRANEGNLSVPLYVRRNNFSYE